MTVSSIGGKSAAAVQSLVDLRKTLDDLQRQLSTGMKSATYAGLGFDRGVTVGLRSQLSAINGFDATADQVQTRLNVAQTSLTRITEISSSTSLPKWRAISASECASASRSTIGPIRCLRVPMPRRRASETKLRATKALVQRCYPHGLRLLVDAEGEASASPVRGQRGIVGG